MYYRIIPLHKTFDTYGLIYHIPDEFLGEIGIGRLVRIPIGNTSTLGICTHSVESKDIAFDLSSIRDIDGFVTKEVFLGKHHIDLIIFISQHYITPIHNAAGLFFPKNLQEKILKNTVEKIKANTYNYNIPNISLSDTQGKIYTDIKNNKSRCHLVYGVTGSGKTQIYMRLIQDALSSGKQSLLLIPEIILTSQIGEKIQSYFGDNVLLLTSGVTPAKKSSYWMDISSLRAKVIVGTRSSLFYPYRDLGLIIIDEEHDPSYISDSAPRYNSIELATKMSELYNCKMILGSGTPKVTTFHKALWGDYVLHQMLEIYED